MNRDLVEVCCQSDQEPGGNHELGRCWWEAELANCKGDFCSVSYVVCCSAAATAETLQGWDKSHDEIVELEYVRPSAGLPNQALHFEKHEIPVPTKLNRWVEDIENLEGLKNKCGAWGLSVQKSSKVNSTV